ncbi:hypothetical protein G6F23_015060 [Rhizopus arrhizus]|nr:hypothetical protein G6F23_015060 [Rhizopus arrhizus]
MGISEAARPAPSRLHSRRKGLSVTPAMGASTTLGAMALPGLPGTHGEGQPQTQADQRADRPEARAVVAGAEQRQAEAHRRAQQQHCSDGGQHPAAGRQR